MRNAQIIFFFHIYPPFASVIVFQHACEGRGMSAVCFCRSRSHRCQLRREPLKVEPVPSDCLSVSNTQSVSRSRRKTSHSHDEKTPWARCSRDQMPFYSVRLETECAALIISHPSMQKTPLSVIPSEVSHCSGKGCQFQHTGLRLNKQILFT